MLLNVFFKIKGIKIWQGGQSPHPLFSPFQRSIAWWKQGSQETQDPFPVGFGSITFNMIRVWSFRSSLKTCCLHSVQGTLASPTRVSLGMKKLLNITIKCNVNCVSLFSPESCWGAEGRLKTDAEGGCE